MFYASRIGIFPSPGGDAFGSQPTVNEFSAPQKPMSTGFDVTLQVVSEGYDRKTCWVHSRAGHVATSDATVMTLQKLRLTGSDVFYALHEMRSDDGGATWNAPFAHENTLGRVTVEGGVEEGISDFSPAWHAASQTLLGTGHTVRYREDNLSPHPRPRSTVYSAYDPAARAWNAWKKLEMPGGLKFAYSGAGCTQRFDLPGGDVLLPTYFGLPETARPNNRHYLQHVSAVMRCSFDGTTLRYVEHGSELTVPEGRGFVEPSITFAGGRYFLTLRNDLAAYVTSGADGLHFDPPKLWTFDDGNELGSYNTQAHWVTHGDLLFLVYTRKGANNDHVFRHRAPLFIAQVDTERLCVMRETERILVPERGARLCNFGVTRISENESWVTVAEWMQTNPPDLHDFSVCEKYGSNNRVYVAKIRFK